MEETIPLQSNTQSYVQIIGHKNGTKQDPNEVC